MTASITLASGDVPLLAAKALRSLGCEIYVYSMGEDLPLLEALLFRNILNFNRDLFNKRLYRCVKEFQPDIFFIYGSNWGIYPATLKKIKSKIGSKVILWEGNLNFWRWYQSESLRHCDHLFTSDSYPIPLLKKETVGLKNVHLLCGGCDPEEHGKMTLSDSDQERFGADITFIGGGRPNRRELFEHLIDYTIKLWGWGWDESPALAPYMVRETVSGLKKTKIYNATKICPNLQSGLYQIYGLSCRIFEVASCGRLPFSEPQQDLGLYFTPGEEVIVFNGPQDFKNKVAYYLSHPDEMNEMAERARARALREHTYTHRMKELLDIVLG